MLRFHGTRGIALALLLAAGCGKAKDPDTTATPDQAASAAEGGSAGAAAQQAATPTPPAPIDAAPAPPPPPEPEPGSSPPDFKYTSIEELLGLAGAEPPDALAGYQLGKPPGKGYYSVQVGDLLAGHTFRTNLTADGKVSHIGVDLYLRAKHADPKAVLDEVEAKVKARWGAPGELWSRRVWRGKKSQLFIGTRSDEYGRAYLTVTLLPAGDDHVCGAGDGFGAFLEKLRAAAKNQDGAAISRMLQTGADEEEVVMVTHLCDGQRGAQLARCVGEIIAELDKRGVKPACNVSQEVWWWATEPGMGGTHFTFQRKNGAWRGYGPDRLDDDRELTITEP